MPRTSSKHFVSADPVVWAESQPGCEVGLCFPSAHVESDFTDERLCGHHVDAIDLGQIHSGDALTTRHSVEIEACTGSVCSFSPGIVVPGTGKAVSAKIERCCLISCRIRRFVAGMCHTSPFLLHYKDQLRAPVAFQAFGNLFSARTNPGMAQFGQFLRIPFSRPKWLVRSLVLSVRSDR